MITQATTTTLVTASPTSIVSGGNVTLTATVNSASNGANPTGTVQFKNGANSLGGAVTCTPSASATAASCTATLTTALSQFVPMVGPQPRLIIPVVPVWISAWLVIFILALTHLARLPLKWKRIGYASTGLLLFVSLALGIAGCSGSKSGGGGGGGGRTDSITAVYGGDANYTGSTSAAATVTIQ